MINEKERWKAGWNISREMSENGLLEEVEYGKT